ncbi:MAG: Crp/Fnr family transcriptional regulator [Pseudomonadota bacterium]
MDIARMARACLEQDIHKAGVALTDTEWDRQTRMLSPVSAFAGEVIQNQAHIADALLFVAGGVVASQQSWEDGNVTVARFFEAGDICANFTSAWTQDIASDDLVAITDVQGLSIPNHVFRREYLSGDGFGLYLRHKMVEAHLFAKELVCAKTSGRTETRYQFLEEFHSGVIGIVPQKDIARFLGVTPQGLSRFLKRQKSAPD